MTGSRDENDISTIPGVEDDGDDIIELEPDTLLTHPPEEGEEGYTTRDQRRGGQCRHWDYESNSKEPIHMSWRQIFGITPHWRCLILTIMISLCFIVLLWCRVPRQSSKELFSPCRDGLIWIPTTITILFYLLYLVECIHCNIHRDLSHMVSAERAHDLLQQWISARPLIRWRAICYHYGRGVRQGCGAGSGIGSVQHLQFMRINSHSSEGRYRSYDCGCMDKSTPIKSLDRYHIVKVDIEKYFSFGCACSEAAYLSQRKAFYENNVAADDYIEVRETFHLSGAEVPDSICVMKSDSPPWFCYKSVYWLFSLVGLSWPFRLYLERRVAYVNFTIHKQFGAQCNGILATSGNSLSSFDSKLSENQYGVIPSYSEALLMSSYTLNGTRVPCTLQNLQSNHPATLYKSYETVSSNRRLLPHIRGDNPRKISLSKTVGNLRQVCPVKLTFRRSSSANSPIGENAEEESPSPECHLLPEIIIDGHKYTPVQKGTTPNSGSLRRSTTTQSIMQTLRKVLPRSKTFSERASLI